MAVVVPSLHPAAILRGVGGDDSSGLAKYLHVVKGDFARAAELRHRVPCWDESSIWHKVTDADGQWRYPALFPRSVEEVYDFCSAARGLPLSVDIEGTGKEWMNCDLICVGMASASGKSLCVPLIVGGGKYDRYWTPGDERRVKEALCWLMLDTETPKWFQNGSVDTTVLWMNGMPVLNWAEDLMQLLHCYDGEMPANLGYGASRCPTTEMPYWKDDAKGSGQWLGADPLTLHAYNLRDCLVPLRAIPWYLGEIRKLGLERLYRAELDQVRIMRKATWRGIEVDLDRRDSSEIVTKELLADPVKAARLGVSEKDLGLHVGLGPRMEKVLGDNLAILRDIAGHPDFNPNSHDQLIWFLFEHLKFPVVLRSKKTNKPSTDKNAMVLLALHAETDRQRAALMSLVRVRKATKNLGTWVRGLPVLGDGRVHFNWKLLAITGRFASSPNCQNWNAWIKRVFCSRRMRGDDGKLARDKYGNYVFLDDFVSVDLNQAELRKMAYFSSDPDLLRMYVDGINVHTANTSLLFQIKCPPAANKKGDQLNAQTESYLREKFAELAISMPEFFKTLYDDLPTYDGDPVFVKERWKGTRTLSKNFVFGDNYGALAETLFDVLRAKRDGNTDEVLFPDLTLGEVEGCKILWENLHPAIPAYWAYIEEHIQSQGYYKSPLSGRIIWFRGGFEQNKMRNYPIQESIAARMEKIIEVNRYLEELTGGSELDVGPDHAIIDMQVHDMVNIETPKKYTEDCKQILSYVYNQPYDWNPPAPFKRYGQAMLPADEPTVGQYVNEI